MLSNKNSYRKGIDWLTVLLYVLLVGFGWLNLYAANFNPETKVFFSVDAEYFKQLIWIGISVLCIGVIMLIDSKFFVEISFVIFGVSILLLIATLVIGKEVNGAKAWIALGPLSFQPVEFTKIGTALVLARMMSRYGFTFDAKAYLRLFGLLLIPIALVLLQNDTGSALIFFVFLLSMYREGMSGHVLMLGVTCGVSAVVSLLAGSSLMMSILVLLAVIVLMYVMRTYHAGKKMGIALLLSVAVGVVAWIVLGYIGQVSVERFELTIFSAVAAMSIYLIIKAIYSRIHNIIGVFGYLWVGLLISFATGYIFENVLIEHQRTRINVLFGVEEDPLGAGYNVNQSLIAIGSGGTLGKGFLEGTQTKLNFVPKQTTDFIFCTVGEEWGFIGSVGLVVVYLCFFIRLILLAEKQHSVFSRVYGYCVASIFFFHFMVNICMTIGLMPVIGIPLPFFSYGGSSLWGFSIMLFIFLKLDTERESLIR
jgi:rod shape determining protein RodA